MSRSRLRRFNEVCILTDRHSSILALERQGFRPSLYGTRVWQSSFWLIDYLANNPIAPDRRVVEVGCGWGLVGIYCAKAFAARVLLTDADDQIFPYVMAHAQLNGVSVETERAAFDAIADDHLQGCDVLLGGDICFWPQLGSQLRRLLERAAGFGVGRIVLADPGRTTFMRMAESCQRTLGAQLIEWRATTRAGATGHLLVLDRD